MTWLIDPVIGLFLFLSFYSISYGFVWFWFRIFKIRRSKKSKYSFPFYIQMIFLVGFLIFIRLGVYVEGMIVSTIFTLTDLTGLLIVLFYFIRSNLGSKNRKSIKLTAAIFLTGIILFGGLLTVTEIFIYSFGLSTSNSMAPTHQKGDLFLLKKYPYVLFSKKPKVGEIIEFKNPTSQSGYLCKRCVAVEGEIVLVDNGVLWVNGSKRVEPYANYSNARGTNVSKYGPVTLSDGTVFVMDDNRGISMDSREFGAINTKTIIGEIWFVLF